MGIRPEHWIPGDGPSVKIEGTVDLVEHLGETSIVYLRLADGQMITVRYPGDIFCTAGDRFVADAPVAAIHLFDAAGQAMLGRRSRPGLRYPRPGIQGTLNGNGMTDTPKTRAGAPKLTRLAEGRQRLPDVTGTNLEHSRIFNRRLIFEVLHQSGPLSRIDIAKRVG